MKLKTLLSFACTALFSASVLAAPQIGAPAPAFTAVDAYGNNVNLSDLAGKTVVLEWTNHECPFVVKHYAGNMQTLQKDFTEQDVVWLSIISSAPGKQGYVSAEKAVELTASRDAAPTAVLFDETGVIGKAYDAKTTPHMYVINTDGNLAYMGGIDSIASAKAEDVAKATPLFANALTAVLAGETPDPAVTRPYGCSIKY